MARVVLDGKEMLQREDVHPYLKLQLNICGYFGNNLDALWDALSTHDQSLEIELVHKAQMLDKLADYGTAIIDVFEDAATENDKISFQIMDD